MIYLHLGSSVCKVIELLIGQMKGGANDLHVIMCYKTEGIGSMQQLQSNIQKRNRLINVTHFNHTNKPPI